MQCSCGGETKDREVAEDKVPVAKYARCSSCGRIHWWWDNRTADMKQTSEKDQEADDRISR